MENGTNDTTSATPRGDGIAEAADAFQNLLTPGNPDTDEEHTEAQPGEKPTAKRTPAQEDEDDDQAGDGEDDESDPDADEEQQGDDPEKGEDEESDPESEEGEEHEGEAEDDQQLYTVTIDGKEEQVTLEELAKGYSRTADYTRKTQAVAQERREAQAERAEASALRDQYAQGLEQLKAALKQVAPQEPDWETLRATDPIEFAAAWADHQRRQETLQQIDQERENVRRQQEHEHAAARAEAVKAGRRWLLQQVPEWADPKTGAARAKADRVAMTEHAAKLGFSAEELKSVDDPRAVLLIRQAMLYQRLMDKKATLIKPVKKPATPTKTPVLKPGSVKSTTSRNTSDLTRAKQRLAKTGSVRDAASVFEKMIGG